MLAALEAAAELEGTAVDDSAVPEVELADEVAVVVAEPVVDDETSSSAALLFHCEPNQNKAPASKRKRFRCPFKFLISSPCLKIKQVTK